MYRKNRLAAQVGLSLMTGMWLFTPYASAMPVLDLTTGGSTVKGATDVANAITTITQNSSAKVTAIQADGASNVINWQDFSVASDEKVVFDATNSAGSGYTKTNDYLNLVTGDASSYLNGNIVGGANVYVVNPKGITIGQDANIDVGSLYLSTQEELKASQFTAVTPTKTFDDVISGASNVKHDIVNLGGNVQASQVQMEGRNIRLVNTADFNYKSVADTSSTKSTTPLSNSNGNVSINASGYVHIGYQATGDKASTPSKDLGYVVTSSTSEYDDYKLITGFEGLKAIQDDIDNGTTNGNYMLANDIDASGEDALSPIGGTTGFSGKFDGNFYKIKNLTLDVQSVEANTTTIPLGNSDHNPNSTDFKATSTANVGLFSYTTTGAVIDNIGLVDLRNNSTGYGSYGGTYTGVAVAGSIVGYAQGTTIRNVYNKLTSSAIDDVGASYWQLMVNPQNVSNKWLSYMGAGYYANAAGGLVGVLENSTIENSYNSGGVYGGAGLVGYLNGGGIKNSYNIGQIYSNNMPGSQLKGYGIYVTTPDRSASTNVSNVYSVSAAENNILGANAITITALYTHDYSSQGNEDSQTVNATQNLYLVKPSEESSTSASTYGFFPTTDGGTTYSSTTDDGVWRIYEGNSLPLLRSFLQANGLNAKNPHPGIMEVSDFPLTYYADDGTPVATRTGVSNDIVYSGFKVGIEQSVLEDWDSNVFAKTDQTLKYVTDTPINEWFYCKNQDGYDLAQKNTTQIVARNLAPENGFDISKVYDGTKKGDTSGLLDALNATASSVQLNPTNGKYTASDGGIVELKDGVSLSNAQLAAILTDTGLITDDKTYVRFHTKDDTDSGTVDAFDLRYGSKNVGDYTLSSTDPPASDEIYLGIANGDNSYASFSEWQKLSYDDKLTNTQNYVLSATDTYKGNADTTIAERYKNYYFNPNDQITGSITPRTVYVTLAKPTDIDKIYDGTATVRNLATDTSTEEKYTYGSTDSENNYTDNSQDYSGNLAAENVSQTYKLADYSSVTNADKYVLLEGLQEGETVAENVSLVVGTQGTYKDSSGNDMINANDTANAYTVTYSGIHLEGDDKDNYVLVEGKLDTEHDENYAFDGTLSGTGTIDRRAILKSDLIIGDSGGIYKKYDGNAKAAQYDDNPTDDDPESPTYRTNTDVTGDNFKYGADYVDIKNTNNESVTHGIIGAYDASTGTYSTETGEIELGVTGDIYFASALGDDGHESDANAYIDSTTGEYAGDKNYYLSYTIGSNSDKATNYFIYDNTPGVADDAHYLAGAEEGAAILSSEANNFIIPRNIIVSFEDKENVDKTYDATQDLLDGVSGNKGKYNDEILNNEVEFKIGGQYDNQHVYTAIDDGTAKYNGTLIAGSTYNATTGTSAERKVVYQDASGNPTFAATDSNNNANEILKNSHSINVYAYFTDSANTKNKNYTLTVTDKADYDYDAAAKALRDGTTYDVDSNAQTVTPLYNNKIQTDDYENAVTGRITPRKLNVTLTPAPAKEYDTTTDVKTDDLKAIGENGVSVSAVLDSGEEPTTEMIGEVSTLQTNWATAFTNLDDKISAKYDLPDAGNRTVYYSGLRDYIDKIQGTNQYTTDYVMGDITGEGKITKFVLHKDNIKFALKPLTKVYDSDTVLNTPYSNTYLLSDSDKTTIITLDNVKEKAVSAHYIDLGNGHTKDFDTYDINYLTYSTENSYNETPQVMNYSIKPSIDTNNFNIEDFMTETEQTGIVTGDTAADHIITPRPVYAHVDATPVTKIYDGTTTVKVNEKPISGLANDPNYDGAIVMENWVPTDSFDMGGSQYADATVLGDDGTTIEGIKTVNYVIDIGTNVGNYNVYDNADFSETDGGKLLIKSDGSKGTSTEELKGEGYITQRELTPTFYYATKTYNGSTSLDDATFRSVTTDNQTDKYTFGDEVMTKDGASAADDVYLTLTGDDYDTANVGDNKDIVYTAVLDGSDAFNYKLSKDGYNRVYMTDTSSTTPSYGTDTVTSGFYDGTAFTYTAKGTINPDTINVANLFFEFNDITKVYDGTRNTGVSDSDYNNYIIGYLDSDKTKKFFGYTVKNAYFGSEAYTGTDGNGTDLDAVRLGTEDAVKASEGDKTVTYWLALSSNNYTLDWTNLENSYGSHIYTNGSTDKSTWLFNPLQKSETNTITPKTITATIANNGQSKVYDGTSAYKVTLDDGTVSTDSNDIVTLSGLVNGDGSSNASYGTFYDKDGSAENVNVRYDNDGNYATQVVKYTPTIANDNGNYTIVMKDAEGNTVSALNGTGTITPKELAATVGYAEKYYNGTSDVTLSGVAITLNGLINDSTTNDSALQDKYNTAKAVQSALDNENGEKVLKGIYGLYEDNGNTFAPDPNVRRDTASNAVLDKAITYSGINALLNDIRVNGVGETDTDTDAATKLLAGNYIITKVYEDDGTTEATYSNDTVTFTESQAQGKIKPLTFGLDDLLAEGKKIVKEYDGNAKVTAKYETAESTDYTNNGTGENAMQLYVTVGSDKVYIPYLYDSTEGAVYGTYTADGGYNYSIDAGIDKAVTYHVTGFSGVEVDGGTNYEFTDDSGGVIDRYFTVNTGIITPKLLTFEPNDYYRKIYDATPDAGKGTVTSNSGVVLDWTASFEDTTANVNPNAEALVAAASGMAPAKEVGVVEYGKDMTFNLTLYNEDGTTAYDGWNYTLSQDVVDSYADGVVPTNNVITAENTYEKRGDIEKRIVYVDFDGDSVSADRQYRGAWDTSVDDKKDVKALDIVGNTGIIAGDEVELDTANISVNYATDGNVYRKNGEVAAKDIYYTDFQLKKTDDATKDATGNYLVYAKGDDASRLKGSGKITPREIGIDLLDPVVTKEYNADYDVVDKENDDGTTTVYSNLKNLGLTSVGMSGAASGDGQTYTVTTNVLTADGATSTETFDISLTDAPTYDNRNANTDGSIRNVTYDLAWTNGNYTLTKADENDGVTWTTDSTGAYSGKLVTSKGVIKPREIYLAVGYADKEYDGNEKVTKFHDSDHPDGEPVSIDQAYELLKKKGDSSEYGLLNDGSTFEFVNSVYEYTDDINGKPVSAKDVAYDSNGVSYNKNVKYTFKMDTANQGNYIIYDSGQNNVVKDTTTNIVEDIVAKGRITPKSLTVSAENVAKTYDKTADVDTLPTFTLANDFADVDAVAYDAFNNLYNTTTTVDNPTTQKPLVTGNYGNITTDDDGNSIFSADANVSRAADGSVAGKAVQYTGLQDVLDYIRQYDTDSDNRTMAGNYKIVTGNTVYTDDTTKLDKEGTLTYMATDTNTNANGDYMAQINPVEIGVSLVDPHIVKTYDGDNTVKEKSEDYGVDYATMANVNITGGTQTDDNTYSVNSTLGDTFNVTLGATPTYDTKNVLRDTDGTPLANKKVYYELSWTNGNYQLKDLQQDNSTEEFTNTAYASGTVSGTLTSKQGRIDPAPLTVTVSDTKATKVYDGSRTAKNIDGLINVTGLQGDDVTVKGGTYNTKDVLTANTVTYELDIKDTANDDMSGNYNISYYDSQGNTLSTLKGEGEITPQNLALSFDKIEKTYNGTANVDGTPQITVTPDDYVSGDSGFYNALKNYAQNGLTGTYGNLSGTAFTPDANVAYNGSVVAPKAVSYTGIDAVENYLGNNYATDYGNYTLDWTEGGTGTLNDNGNTLYFSAAADKGQINPRTISLGDIQHQWQGTVSKDYDGTTAVTSVNGGTNNAADALRLYVNGVTGDIDYNLGSAVYTDKNAGTGKDLTYTVSGLAGNSSGNYIVTGGLANATFSTLGDSANKASDFAAIINPLTVTASQPSAVTKVYDGTTSVTTLPTISFSGVLPGETLTVTNLTGTYDDKNAADAESSTNPKNHVVTYTFGLSSGNYQMADGQQNNGNAAQGLVTGSGTITRAPLTLTAEPMQVVAGMVLNAGFTGNVSGSIGNEVTASDFTWGPTEADTNQIAGTYPIYGWYNDATSGNFGLNYTFENVANESLTITPMPTNTDDPLDPSNIVTPDYNVYADASQDHTSDSASYSSTMTVETMRADGTTANLEAATNSDVSSISISDTGSVVSLEGGDSNGGSISVNGADLSANTSLSFAGNSLGANTSLSSGGATNSTANASGGGTSTANASGNTASDTSETLNSADYGDYANTAAYDSLIDENGITEVNIGDGSDSSSGVSSNASGNEANDVAMNLGTNGTGFDSYDSATDSADTAGMNSNGASGLSGGDATNSDSISGLSGDNATNSDDASGMDRNGTSDNSGMSGLNADGTTANADNVNTGSSGDTAGSETNEPNTDDDEHSLAGGDNEAEDDADMEIQNADSSSDSNNNEDEEQQVTDDDDDDKNKDGEEEETDNESAEIQNEGSTVNLGRAA